MTPQLKWVAQCARCYRAGIAIVHCRRTLLDVMLGRPARTYRVCIYHIPGRKR